MIQPKLSSRATYYQTLTERATGSPWRMGNSFELLQNGDAIFPAMLDAIRGATESIEFLSYVFWRSDIATDFTRALVERAKAGVKVRVLVDAFGGATMSSRAIWQLERAGVLVGWYHPGRWQYLWLLNNRTHRKLLIVDGRIGFTGGVGIAEAWTGNGQDRDHFRETQCRIEGPAVVDLHAGFADNWPDSSASRLSHPRPAAEAGSVAVHTTISRASVRPSEAQRLFREVFASTQSRLWITSAYFVPSQAIQSDLRAAARRGVDVRVLTNGATSNHRFTTMAGRASYQSLLNAGVKIYEYKTTMHHAKVITADGVWGTIGSVNIDARSLVLNDELNVSVLDERVVGAMDHQFLADLEQSAQIKASAWRTRGRMQRLAESGVSIFAGQL
jgi:cardiolipin synthase